MLKIANKDPMKYMHIWKYWKGNINTLRRKLLGWDKSNCGFCIAEICHLILEYIINKCGYVIYHFNAHFLLCVFANELLLAIYFLCILDYGNGVRQKANLRDFLIGVQSGS